VRANSEGSHVSGNDFETLVYLVDDSADYQTTFAYWRQLTARATEVDVRLTTQGVGTDSGGRRGRCHS
jgi:hypothetical protein